MSDKIIELKNITFQYPQSSGDVLNDVSFSVKHGEWLAIIGPNGSGKSTLAKMINGLLVPQSGEVYVKDTLLTIDTVWDIRSSVGMVFQNPDNQFVGATVEDDVAFGLENNGVPRDKMIKRVTDALESVRMSQLRDKEPARLSGGQKQRVAIASVIALRPDVIILDEATAMLDPNGRQEVMEVIERLKDVFDLTVISITHDIDEAARADRILVIDQGEIKTQDTPAEIFSMGDKLIEIGLNVPFAQQLRDVLKQRGVNVPDEYMNEEALLKWITQSYLTM